MAPRKNEIVEESYYTLILCCFFVCEIKKNNNKKPLNSYDVQITKLLHLSFFIFKSLGRGGMV